MAKNRKPTAAQQAALDARAEDNDRLREHAWNLAKGNPQLEALYRSEVGDPPEQ